MVLSPTTRLDDWYISIECVAESDNRLTDGGLAAGWTSGAGCYDDVAYYALSEYADASVSVSARTGGGVE